jgi:hypothetical protein
VAPVVARSTTGVYTLTWAATQQDEITNTAAPGYTGPLPINFRCGFGNSEGAATFYDVKCKATAPNVITCWIWSGGSPPALVDPTGVAFDVLAF